MVRFALALFLAAPLGCCGDAPPPTPGSIAPATVARPAVPTSAEPGERRPVPYASRPIPHAPRPGSPEVAAEIDRIFSDLPAPDPDAPTKTAAQILEEAR